MNNQKIRFTLEGYNLWGFAKPNALEYESDAEMEFACKERVGTLLAITQKPFQQEENGTYIYFPCAIVSDDADGKVYIIDPENIQFYKH